jgi:hypothetical protein
VLTRGYDTVTNCKRLGRQGLIKGKQMVKSAFSIGAIAAVAAVAGIALVPAAASAATAGPAVLAHSFGPSDGSPTGGSATTPLTFTVTSGDLSITAPTTSATLGTGTGLQGTTMSGNLGGPVTVTDNRAALVAAWTVSASVTNWSSTTLTTTKTIPATNTTYLTGDITSTGGITATPVSANPIALAITPTLPAPASDVPVVHGPTGSGDNTATWDPTIAVLMPLNVVADAYTATLTQSVF